MPSLCVEELQTEQSVITCMSTGPIFKRMKVLKKFKKKIGLVSSSRGVVQSPLRFHFVCGDNIRLENDCRIARRSDSFCKGIVFSSRSVKTNERVYIRLIEISSNWSGVIRFGFTTQDPNSSRDSLPKYVCPDLTNTHGYWAKALNERHSSQGLIVSYYVTPTGDVHFALNGEEKGIFFSGVETRSPLWSVIDVYGNCLAIEMLDPREGLNNRVSIVNNLRPGSSVADSRIIVESQQTQNILTRSQPLPQWDGVQDLCSQVSHLELCREQTICRTPQYFPSDGLCPFPFHRVKGRNVSFNNDKTIATRVQSEYSHGYVFSSRPIIPGEHFIIQIVENQAPYVGAMSFGMTSANPAGLDAKDMPEDCDLLLDRPEYWVVSKDVASSPAALCEIAFGLSHNGEILMSKGGRPTQVVMHVDITQQLWAFWDLFGNTSKIRMMGILPHSTPFCFPAPVSIPKEAPTPRQPIHAHSPRTQTNCRSHYDIVQTRNQTVKQNVVSSIPNQCLTQVSSPIYQTVSSQMGTIPTGPNRMLPVPNEGSNNPFHECTVCYEADVDSVLYSCGHMCMCYECALQQWRGRGGGHCPICRAIIRDVIRTYRS